MVVVPEETVTVIVNGTLALPDTALHVLADFVIIGLIAFVIGTETSTVGRVPVYFTWVPLAILESGLITGFTAAEPINRNE
jgi:hypothetical protein